MYKKKRGSKIKLEEPSSLSEIEYHRRHAKPKTMKHWGTPLGSQFAVFSGPLPLFHTSSASAFQRT